jgi:hypothetical protein
VRPFLNLELLTLSTQTLLFMALNRKYLDDGSVCCRYCSQPFQPSRGSLLKHERKCSRASSNTHFDETYSAHKIPRALVNAFVIIIEKRALAQSHSFVCFYFTSQSLMENSKIELNLSARFNSSRHTNRIPLMNQPIELQALLQTHSHPQPQHAVQPPANPIRLPASPSQVESQYECDTLDLSAMLNTSQVTLPSSSITEALIPSVSTSVAACCVRFDVRQLHRDPYDNDVEKQVAILSVRNSSYGAELDRTLDAIRSFANVFHIPYIPSAYSLAVREKNSLADGLRFVPQIIDVPSMSSLGEELTSILYPVTASIRKDLGYVVAEMLTRPFIWPHLHWRFEKKTDARGERLYEGFYTANAWMSIQKQMGENANLAGILIFSDATRILKFGERSLHPIYICPAGLSHEHMSIESMTLVGFMPQLPPIRDLLASTKKTALAHWTRLVIASVYAHIIDLIHQHTTQGIHITLEDMEARLVHPFVLTAVTDHPEGNCLALLETLVCRYCTAAKGTFSQIVECQPRTEESYLDETPHPLLRPRIGPFRPFFTAHCILHDIEEGIWKYVCEKVILATFSHSADQLLLTHEIALRSRHPPLQHIDTFTESSLKNLTARQHRQQIVQITVTLAALTFAVKSKHHVFLVMLNLCQWYSVVRSTSTSETEIEKISRWGPRLMECIKKAVELNGIDATSRAIKPHVVVHHYPDLIREYGAMLYTSCEMWDSAHKFIIKAPLSSHGGGNYQELVEERVSLKKYEVLETIKTCVN